MVVSGEIKKKQTGATCVCVCVVYVYIYIDILLITVMDLLLFKTNYMLVCVCVCMYIYIYYNCGIVFCIVSRVFMYSGIPSSVVSSIIFPFFTFSLPQNFWLNNTIYVL